MAVFVQVPACDRRPADCGVGVEQGAGLERLAELLGEPGASGPDTGGGAVVIWALAGAPGVGKTLLAACYAWASQAARWPVVAWIAAETPDQILAGLAAPAERLGERRPDDDTMVVLGS
ncbi:hypothetical protein [Nonomuraea zeae]|uniref:hypothetical protein n=1 Tax=Nonomuraea zeae TaxID=1642303 RepID=UPI00147862A8|nr:hypothetical protein [Nonomuraea zeae]